MLTIFLIGINNRPENTGNRYFSLFICILDKQLSHIDISHIINGKTVKFEVEIFVAMATK